MNSPFKNLINSEFESIIEKEEFPTGLSESIISLLSEKKKEPFFLKKFRLNAYNKWKKMSFPNWSQLKINQIDFQNIIYYSVPKKQSTANSLNAIDPKILEVFEKLGIPLSEQKILANVAIDAVFDSKSIVTTYQEKLGKQGVIFCSISEAIEHYPNLIEKYLGSVVSSGDNFFAALNSSVFSDGSFCFIPKNIKCPLDLSTYFRINDKNSGQFERTLIIAEKNSEITYLEGCTAPRYDLNQLHAAIVELILFENAKINYFTVQNWSSGDFQGRGGIYNFVTKRALCIGQNSHVSWTQIETGSSITWKYPSSILIGKNSSGEFYSLSFTDNYQQADTGTKMLHLGEKTRSKIVAKSISMGYSRNFYRGLVKMSSKSNYSKNFSQCDSFLIGEKTLTSTYPYLEIYNSASLIEHEATISKISDEQLFYCLQRGIEKTEAINLLITGFCKDILIKLPLEFALEANKLLSLKLENGIG